MLLQPKFLLCFLLFSVFCGPAGAIGITLAWLYSRLTVKHGGLEDYLSKIQRPEIHLTEFEILKREVEEVEILKLSDHLSLLNYKDIILHGESSMKQGLIGLLSFQPDAQNIRLIRLGLEDKDDGVRVMAATALQKIDDYFVQKILTIKRKKDPSLNQELIRICEEYLRCRILGPEDEQDLVQSLSAIYRELLYTDGINWEDENCLKWFKLLVDFNRLNELHTLWAQMPAARKLHPEFALIGAAMYYQMREPKAIALLLRSVPVKDLQLHPEILNLARFWSGK